MLLFFLYIYRFIKRWVINVLCKRTSWNVCMFGGIVYIMMWRNSISKGSELTCILNTTECQRCACNYNMNYCLVASHKLNRNVISWDGLSLSHVSSVPSCRPGVQALPTLHANIYQPCHSCSVSLAQTKRRGADWWRQRHVTTNSRVTSQQHNDN